MKYENFKPVQEAMERLKRIKAFEEQQAREPEGSITLIPCNGDMYSHLKVPGPQQDLNQGTSLDNALAKRLNSGNHDIHQGIMNSLKVAKQELCTFLHNAGVDITELTKELKL